jgi:GMP synthase-like glutamine amidotransferase
VLFEGLGLIVSVFKLHGETVPTDVICISRGGGPVRNQVVRFGEKAYGLQCHFELTEDLLERWLDEDPELESIDRTFTRNDYQRLRDSYDCTGRTIFSNFLNVACGV